MIDVTGAWAVKAGGDGLGKWREAGHSADAKAKVKWASYEGALDRQKMGGKGWLVKGKGVLMPGVTWYCYTNSSHDDILSPGSCSSHGPSKASNDNYWRRLQQALVSN
eukprot:COSAG02_NODE_316_length_24889_cov_9.418556_14_plen_108_part_00